MRDQEADRTQKTCSTRRTSRVSRKRREEPSNPKLVKLTASDRPRSGICAEIVCGGVPLVIE